MRPLLKEQSFTRAAPVPAGYCAGQILCIFATLLFVALIVSCRPAPEVSRQPTPKPAAKANPPVISTYPADFQSWLTANPDQANQFDDLKAYLTREGVADVLPLWQLVQTETLEAAAKCEIVAYAVPPKDMWPTIVPTLRLVREQIVPLLGPVKVLSSFRTNQANRCSAGAPESPHKRYSALDLAMVTPLPQKEMFAQLCKHWYGLSPQWGYGLGAYYVRGYLSYNQEGRFHVDTLGRRTWGYSYGAYTSHCRELGYIKVKSPEQLKLEEDAKLKAVADTLAKVEADAKTKLDSEAKAKAEAFAAAKLKAKEDVRLKAIEAANAMAKAKLDGRVPTDMTKGQNSIAAPVKGDPTKEGDS